MTDPSTLLTRSWLAALLALLVLSVIGAFGIPQGQDVVIRVSWGDWTPVGYASKWFALTVLPGVAFVFACYFTLRRWSRETDSVPPSEAITEGIVMVTLLAVHAIIVFGAL